MGTIVVLGPQPMHLDIICKLTVTQEIGQRPKLCTNKSDGSGMMVDPSAHPQHMNCLTHCICMWEPFHVVLGPQPMHLDIICNLAGVNLEIS